MFGKFNEAGKPKTSLAKYFVKFNFNDLAVPSGPRRRSYLRLIGRTYILLHVKRSVGRLEIRRIVPEDPNLMDYIL